VDEKRQFTFKKKKRKGGPRNPRRGGRLENKEPREGRTPWPPENRKILARKE